jgi:hypothetical protein
MEKTDVADGNSGCEAPGAGPEHPKDFRGASQSRREATLVTRGALGLLVSKLRCARPPFVVSEISDSKAASSKPDARAKTGATARSEADSDRFSWQRKRVATV